MSIYMISQSIASSYADHIPVELLNELEREYYRCLVCEDDDTRELQATILWEFRNIEDETKPSEAEILWFFCADREAGREILRTFDENAKERDVKRAVFEMPEISDEETAALEASGYSIKSSESMSIYVTVEQLRAVKQFSKKPLSHIKPLSDITSWQYKAGIMNCVYHKIYGLLDDLTTMPVSRFDTDISCCALMDGHINGLLLIHEVKPGIYRPELLFSVEPDASLQILNMLRFSNNVLLEQADAESAIQIKRHNKAVLMLTEKLFPDIKGDMVKMGIKKY